MKYILNPGDVLSMKTITRGWWGVPVGSKDIKLVQSIEGMAEVIEEPDKWFIKLWPGSVIQMEVKGIPVIIKGAV